MIEPQSNRVLLKSRDLNEFDIFCLFQSLTGMLTVNKLSYIILVHCKPALAFYHMILSGMDKHQCLKVAEYSARTY